MEIRTIQTDRWHRLGPIDQVPLGEGRRFSVAGAFVAVFRSRSGHVFAVDAVCPHQNGPIEDGLVGQDSVTCPLHGYKFDLRTGAALRHACGDLRAYVVRISDTGDILLARGSSPAGSEGAHP